MITSTARYGVGRNQRIQLGRHREFLVKERKWCIPTLVHLRQRNWFLVYFTYHFFFFHPIAIDPQEVSLLTSQLLRWLTVNIMVRVLPSRSEIRYVSTETHMLRRIGATSTTIPNDHADFFHSFERRDMCKTGVMYRDVIVGRTRFRYL